jgi:non-ribosomal peptide synthetase component F
METTAIHRIIEQHAAVRGDAPALLDDGRALTYRDLNQRANVVARCLLAHGFRRGTTALINMPRSFDLAVACLGVLKAGGAYAWLDNDRSWPKGISIPQRDGAGDELKSLVIDVTGALSSGQQSSANLPILTRGTDIACVLGGVDSERTVLVPHATVTALLAKPVPEQLSWSDDPAAIELWVGLMAGATVTMAPQAELAAA